MAFIDMTNNQTRLVRANTSHPLHDAVRRIVLATYGPPAVIADEIAGINGADAALLFGSWPPAIGASGGTPNDIDVLVIGDADRDAVDDTAERAERRIGLPGASHGPQPVPMGRAARESVQWPYHCPWRPLWLAQRMLASRLDSIPTTTSC